MIGLLIDKWVKSHWGAEYIHIDSIKSHLAKAREEEASKWKKIIEDEKQHVSDLKDMEMHIEVSAIKAEVMRLQREIDEGKVVKKMVERQGLLNKRDAQQNLTISTEWKLTAGKLLETLSVVSAKFGTLTTKAEQHVAELDKRPDQIDAPKGRLTNSLIGEVNEDKDSKDVNGERG